MGSSLFLWCVFPLMKLSACRMSPMIFIWKVLAIFFAWKAYDRVSLFISEQKL